MRHAIYIGLALILLGCATGTQTNGRGEPEQVRAAAQEEPGRREPVRESEHSEPTGDVDPEAFGEHDLLPSKETLVSEVVDLIPLERAPILSGDGPLLRVQDTVRPYLVFVLATSEPAPRVDYEELSRLARAYDPEVAPVDLVVEVFQPAAGKLRRAHSVALGEAKAIGEFRIFPLDASEGPPWCASLEVYTSDGTEVRWALVPREGQPTTFVLERSSRVTSEARDVDDDGILDVVKTLRAAEAGVGYETYMSLYQWNGRAMVETDTVTIVRATNLFLDRALDLIRNSRWEQFVRHSLTQEELDRRRAAGWDTIDIARALLAAQNSAGDGAEPYPFLDPDNDVTEVFAAPILENPFGRQRRFRHDFRLVCCGGLTYIVSLRVQLSANPFEDRIVTLVPWE